MTSTHIHWAGLMLSKNAAEGVEPMVSAFPSLQSSMTMLSGIIPDLCSKSCTKNHQHEHGLWSSVLASTRLIHNFMLEESQPAAASDMT